jgi:hypothetical protein
MSCVCICLCNTCSVIWTLLKIGASGFCWTSLDESLKSQRLLPPSGLADLEAGPALLICLAVLMEKSSVLIMTKPERWQFRDRSDRMMFHTCVWRQIEILNTQTKINKGEKNARGICFIYLYITLKLLTLGGKEHISVLCQKTCCFHQIKADQKHVKHQHNFEWCGSRILPQRSS